MTRYFDASSGNLQVNTIFTHIIENRASIRQLEDGEHSPEEYDNVTMIIKDDVDYKDVFLAWDNGEEDDKIIFFGKAGIEFINQTKKIHESIH